jgi:uncharacterized Zn-finger protein
LSPPAPARVIVRCAACQPHRDEYAGQWVALKGGQLISHGPHGREVMEAARRAGHPDVFLKLVPSAEESKCPIF